MRWICDSHHTKKPCGEVESGVGQATHERDGNRHSADGPPDPPHSVKEAGMRVMVFMLTTPQQEASGAAPAPEYFTEMAKFNEELVNAGVLLDGDGLRPSADGARLHFHRGETTVIDGPFTESKELVAGYWILQ